MTLPYDSISSIGASPLGAMGLGYGGMYGSYGDPMSMMMGMGGIGSMGMMGMYNPTFMRQVIDTQHTIENSQIQHAKDIHDALTQAEVEHLSAHDRAIFQKISVDGEVQNEIRTLGDKIRSGDSDAIIKEYDILKSLIMSKFSNLLSNETPDSASKKVDRYICKKYSEIYSRQPGEIADLKEDIKKYGETPFTNGFNRTFLGNSGHNKRYSEEVISYIEGNTRINDKGSKDRAQKWGDRSAHVVEGISAAVAGGAAGLGVLGLGKLLPGIKVSFFKNAKWAGWLGAAAVLTGDILWQMSRSNT